MGIFDDDDEERAHGAIRASDETVEQATQAGKSLWERVTSAADEVYESASSTAGDVYDRAAETAGVAYEAASEAAGQAYDTVSEAAGQAYDTASDYAVRAADSVEAEAPAAMEAAEQFVEERAERAMDIGKFSAGLATGNAEWVRETSDASLDTDDSDGNIGGSISTPLGKIDVRWDEAKGFSGSGEAGIDALGLPYVKGSVTTDADLTVTAAEQHVVLGVPGVSVEDEIKYETTEDGFRLQRAAQVELGLKDEESFSLGGQASFEDAGERGFVATGGTGADGDLKIPLVAGLAGQVTGDVVFSTIEGTDTVGVRGAGEGDVSVLEESVANGRITTGVGVRSDGEDTWLAGSGRADARLGTEENGRNFTGYGDVEARLDEHGDPVATGRADAGEDLTPPYDPLRDIDENLSPALEGPVPEGHPTLASRIEQGALYVAEQAEDLADRAGQAFDEAVEELGETIEDVDMRNDFGSDAEADSDW